VDAGSHHSENFLSFHHHHDTERARGGNPEAKTAGLTERNIRLDLAKQS
jgi:hypothetical protein